VSRNQQNEENSIMNRKHFISGLVALPLIAGGSAFAANPVLVDPAGVPSASVFNTVQGAIDAYCVGGVNAGETPPLVINIKTGVGNYTEKMTLADNLTAAPGRGNVAGDIVIQSDTAGTKATIMLLLGWSGGGDGLLIRQTGDIDVTFRDIIFAPAPLATTALPDAGLNDELVLINEGGVNAIENTYSFIDCIFTDTTNPTSVVPGVTPGAPAITSRAQAFIDPVSTMGGAGSNDNLLQAPQVAGESYNLYLRGCVFYANRGAADNGLINGANATPGFKTINLTLAGANTNVFTIHNCVFSYSRDFGIHVTGTASKAGTINITGDDVTAGLDNCTVVWKTFNVSGSSLLLNATGLDAIGMTYNVNNTFIQSSAGSPITQVGLNKGSANGEGTLNASDVIINTTGVGIQITPRSGLDTFERVTVHQFGTGGASHVSILGTPVGDVPVGSGNAGGGTAAVSFAEMIFSGPGTGFSTSAAPAAPATAYTGPASVNNSAFVEAGTDAIASRGTLTLSLGSTIVTADPEYVGTDPLLATAFDVNNAAYNAAGVSGALSGGADYVGIPAPPVLSAGGWSLYN